MRNTYVFHINTIHRSIFYQIVNKIVKSKISKNYFNDMIEAYNHFEDFKKNQN